MRRTSCSTWSCLSTRISASPAAAAAAAASEFCASDAVREDCTVTSVRRQRVIAVIHRRLADEAVLPTNGHKRNGLAAKYVTGVRAGEYLLVRDSMFTAESRVCPSTFRS
jgi:hypothetical protein